MKKSRLSYFVFCLLFLFGSFSIGVQADEDQWQEERTDHFSVYYQKTPKDFAKTVAESAEQYYESITADLGFTRYKGWTYNARAKIYIYDSQEKYVQSTNMTRWSHGAADIRQKVIYTFPQDSGFFDTILPHELGHIIFREFVGEDTDFPLWLDEGVACYQEKARRASAQGEVRQAIKENRFIPLSQLALMQLDDTTNEEVVELYYAESASAVSFIINQLGKDRFFRFCQKLNEGLTMDSALDSVYLKIKSLNDLNSAWYDFLLKEE